MQKLYLFIFFLFSCTLSYSQTAYPFQDIKLEKPSDYKETEPLALSAAGFLLGNPFSETDANRAAALKFLSEWMMGTKEPSFYMQGVIRDVSYDKGLLSLYVAAMAKYTLENKKEAVNPMTVELHACKMVLAYCDDPKNNFKLKKKYRKILEKNQPA